MNTVDSGIDYGFGQTNIGTDTGIRYGVIHSNKLASHAWDEIYANGQDLDYIEAMEQMKSELASAIKSTLSDYSVSFNAEKLAESIIDDLDFDFESTGDCTRYSYESDGLAFNVCSDGDIFVTKSPFFTYAAFCSPCAPGAGSLGSDGSVKTYCLGPDWFDSEAASSMPYVCFRVSDGSRVTTP